MKKLIIILLLIPFFGISQILVEDVSVMSLLNKKKDTHSSMDVTTNMSIYIENGYFYIKSDIDWTKSKIIKTLKAEDTGYESDTYIIMMDGEEEQAYTFTDKKNRGLMIVNNKRKETTIFYERRDAN
jgi:hypothetical protein